MMRSVDCFVAGLWPGWVTVIVSFACFALPASIRRTPALVGFRTRTSLFFLTVEVRRPMTPLPWAGRSSTATLPHAPLQVSLPIASLPCANRAASASLKVPREAGGFEPRDFELDVGTAGAGFVELEPPPGPEAGGGGGQGGTL